jgi:hypothetical protein
VVVVEEDGSVRLRLELGDHGVGETRVDGDVPLLPGEMQPAIEIRRVRQVPQVVLQEPQRRVRDDVVEPVVRRLLVHDEAQAVRRPIAGRLLDRVAAALLGDGTILLAHRGCDPGDVVQGDEAPQRSHQTAPTAARDSLAALVPSERDGRAIGNDDQFPAVAHARTLPQALRVAVAPLRQRESSPSRAPFRPCRYRPGD